MFVVVVTVVMVVVVVVPLVVVMVVPVTVVSVLVVSVAVLVVVVVMVNVSVVVLVTVAVVVPNSVRSTRIASNAVSVPTAVSAKNGATFLRVSASDSTSAVLVPPRKTIVKINLCRKV